MMSMHHNSQHKPDINIPLLLFYVVMGWLIASQMALVHIQLSGVNSMLSFYLGMFSGIIGSMAGFLAYQKGLFRRQPQAERAQHLHN